MFYKVRASPEVVRKAPDASGRRHRTISTPDGDKRTLVFGHEPVFLSCEELPKEIAGDEHLLATQVETVDPGIPIIDLDLKAERVQADDTAPPGDPGLKAERVQAAPAPKPKPTTKRR